MTVIYPVLNIKKYDGYGTTEKYTQGNLDKRCMDKDRKILMRISLLQTLKTTLI